MKKSRKNKVARILKNTFDLLICHSSNSKALKQYSLSNITQLLTNKYYDSERPTSMYIFGWLQSPMGDTTHQLIDAYIERGDYNFIVLDWSDYSTDLYTIVMLRMSKMSRIVGRVLTKLFKKGLNDETFHCIGHSFGKLSEKREDFCVLKKFRISLCQLKKN